MVVSNTTTAPACPVVTAVDRGPRRQCGRCRMVFVLHEDGHVPARGSVDVRTVSNPVACERGASMLRMHWNAMRVGDEALVDDDDDLTAPLARHDHDPSVVARRLERPRDPPDRRDGCCDTSQRRGLPPVALELGGLLAMRCARGGQAEERGVSAWEYLIVALPKFGAASVIQGRSVSVGLLNEHGAEGWEAVGIDDPGRWHRRSAAQAVSQRRRRLTVASVSTASARNGGLVLVRSFAEGTTQPPR